MIVFECVFFTFGIKTQKHLIFKKFAFLKSLDYLIKLLKEEMSSNN